MKNVIQKIKRAYSAAVHETSITLRDKETKTIGIVRDIDTIKSIQGNPRRAYDFWGDRRFRKLSQSDIAWVRENTFLRNGNWYTVIDKPFMPEKNITDAIIFDRLSLVESLGSIPVCPEWVNEYTTTKVQED